MRSVRRRRFRAVRTLCCDGICNQRLYLLAQLKRQGLDLSALDSAFNALIANKILYVLPAVTMDIY